MRPILVAVDFSNTSLHALEYAIALGNKMKSDIHLVWVDKITSVESLYPDTSNQNRNEAKRRFEEIIRQYKKKLAKGITMEYKLRKGKVSREVDTYARQIEAELVVAGAHGISGYEEFLIGSNAFKIVTYSITPVITIRNDFPVTKKIDKIIVPIDSSHETLQKIPFVVKLARLFESEVHIVATHTSHLKSIQRLAQKVAQTAVTFLNIHEVRVVEDSIVSNDLTKALLAYADSVKGDMIAIMTEQETPVTVLLGPQAQQLINQSLIPVLSIHPQENFSL